MRSHRSSEQFGHAVTIRAHAATDFMTGREDRRPYHTREVRSLKHCRCGSDREMWGIRKDKSGCDGGYSVGLGDHRGNSGCPLQIVALILPHAETDQEGWLNS